MSIVYRESLGRPLSWQELDGNFHAVDEMTTKVAADVMVVEQQVTNATNAATTATNAVSQATSQADRAKSEADRASQISGLDTVADAIELAAVPLPDVWIPFNDSMRMLAGYAREVKVGNDVVGQYATLTRSTTATYNNKSLTLTNAAINEPRFERSGLLREPQSTNFCQYAHPALAASSSEDGRFYYPSSDRVTVSSVVDTLPDGSSGQCSQVSGVSSGYIRIQSSSPRTASFRLKNISGRIKINGVSTSGYTAGGCIIEPDGTISSVTGKMVAKSLGTTVSGWLRFSFYDPDANMAVEINTNAIDSVSFKITDGQMEPLSFATSYIPTNGSAVTRTADKITIPRMNNDCVEWYSGSDKITPIITVDTIELVPPVGKLHLRNVKGFFTPLTEAQKKGLK
ncbi:MAG: phage head spike fiber domain-containing protein [Plesiomonas sp.]